MIQRLPPVLAALGLLALLGAASEPEGVLDARAKLGPHRLVDGVTIELVAAEPLVFDPVDLEFDASGRAFVLEMGGYPETEDSDRRGRIVLLEDRDRNGTYDARRIFADGFRYADSILPYQGGLLVADAPEVLFVKDTDDDGRADLRQVVLEGFSLGPSESNVNGLAFGPDGWVYAANGSSGGQVRLTEEAAGGDAPDAIPIRGLDVRFRFAREEKGHQLTEGRLESAGPMGGGFGVTFDDWGRRFVTHEQRHIQVEVLPRRLLPESAGWPRTVEEISDHGRGGQTRVYPVSDTQERPNHPEQAGFFTAGSGLTHYGGDAAPSLRGQFFVGETVHNLVHRDAVEPAGASFTARRVDENFEFLAARDLSFRPVNYTVGPDGALYVLDMSRDVIEHPEWIPDDMEAQIDVRGGADRGRIYRLYEGEPPLPPYIRSLRTYDSFALVEALQLDNQWHRATARRLLAEQQEPGTFFLLRDQLASEAPRARLEALFALEALEALPRLTAEHVAPLLRDPEAVVRERAFLALGARALEPGLLEAALEGVVDPKPRVRLVAMLQLTRAARSLSLEGLKGAARREREALLERIDAALVAAAQGGVQEPWLRTAAVVAAEARPDAWWSRISSWPTPPSSLADAHAALWHDIGQRWGQGGGTDLVDDVLGSADGEEVMERALLTGLRAGLRDRLSGEEAPWPTSRRIERRLLRWTRSTDEDVQELGWGLARTLGTTLQASSAELAAASAVVLDGAQEPPARLRALRVLLAADPPELQQTLFDLLDPTTPADLRRTALDALTEPRDPDASLPIAQELLARWQALGPAERRGAGDFLLGRRAHHELLLDALENGTIQRGEMRLDLERRRTLLRWSSPEIGARAARLFSDSGVRTRAEALEAARGALHLEGVAARGRKTFDELCATCHALRGVADGSVGPDLTDLYRKSAAGLLHDIVDPNAQVSPEYLAYDVALASGDVVSGLLTDDAGDVVIRLATGERTVVQRSDIREIRASGLSMMPEELEADLELQALADLLAFLRTPR